MKSVFYQILILAVLFATTTQCRSPQKIPAKTAEAPALQKHTYQQALMGTRFLMTFYAKGKPQADEAARAAFQFADDVNSACSDYDVTSELMKLNAAPHNQPVPITPLLLDVLSRGLKIAKQTNGAYDPTLGHHSYNWRMARKKGELPSPKKITQAKAASGWRNLLIDPATHSATKLVTNMRLDLGGIAKGYAADGMLRVLNDHAITRASITAGGEVRLGEPPPDQPGWNVSLKTLDAHHQLSPAVITLSNCSVSTSGDLHQSITIDGQQYSHIVNSSTGLGLTTRVSATIIANNTTLTDALATAYCVNPTLTFLKAKTLVILAQHDGTLKRMQSENWPSPTPH